MASPEREQDASPLFPSEEAFSQAATSILRQLHELTRKVEGVSALNPLAARGRLKELAAELQALDREYFRCLEHSYVEMSKRVTGGSLAAPVLQLNQLAGSLPFFLRLESSWARAQAALEYKRAYAVAILAFYVSTLSCVFGVISLVNCN